MKFDWDVSDRPVKRAFSLPEMNRQKNEVARALDLEGIPDEINYRTKR